MDKLYDSRPCELLSPIGRTFAQDGDHLFCRGGRHWLFVLQQAVVRQPGHLDSIRVRSCTFSAGAVPRIIEISIPTRFTFIPSLVQYTWRRTMSPRAQREVNSKKPALRFSILVLPLPPTSTAFMKCMGGDLLTFLMHSGWGLMSLLFWLHRLPLGATE